MPLIIWNCVLSFKQQNYFRENGFILPRNYFHNRIARLQLFATQVFSKWQMGFSGGKFATLNLVYRTVLILGVTFQQTQKLDF